MTEKGPSKWQAKVVSATITLLAAAAGARLAWWLLHPLIPLLLLVVTLAVVYSIIFRRL